MWGVAEFYESFSNGSKVLTSDARCLRAASSIQMERDDLLHTDAMMSDREFLAVGAASKGVC